MTTRTSSPRPPGSDGIASSDAIVGIENEFNLYRDRVRVDFRSVVDRLARYEDVAPHVGGPFQYRLSSGSLLAADRSCAEMATPPSSISRPGLAELDSAVVANRNHLLELIARLREDVGGDWRLDGASTHLNLYFPQRSTWEICGVVARTLLPALILLSERKVSGGVIVRPRPHRVELCLEYLPEPSEQRAVVLFATAAYQTLARRVLAHRYDEVPLWLNPGELERPETRRGLQSTRASFGGALYDRGRRARVPVSSRGASILRAQEILERWAAFASDRLRELGEPADLRTLERIIGGTERLSIERTEPAPNYYDVQPVPAEARPGALARAFGAATQVRRFGDVTLRARRIAWSGVDYEVRGSHGPVPCPVPRAWLPALEAWLEREQPGAIATGLYQLAGGGIRPGATVPGAPATSAVAPQANPPAPREMPRRAHTRDPGRGPPKTKRPADALCSTTLLSPAIEDQPPFVEICVPETRDPLRVLKPQEPPMNAALKGFGIATHNGGFLHQALDLAAKSLGIPFEFQRYYRSFIDYDGIMGLGWDHVYNQRVVPTRPATATPMPDGWCEIYTGPHSSRSGDLWLCDGSGRRTFHAFSTWHHRTLRKCHEGALVEFQAVVSDYAINPGERAEVQRVAVYAGPQIWGEPIYYTRRSYDGTEQVFNCHGYVIALRDANRSTFRFIYGPPFNPATRFDLLRKITDTNGRDYSLDYEWIAGGWRLRFLRDPWARQVEFVYNSAAELTDVLGPRGQHPENRTQYRYSGRPGLLTEVVRPKQAALPGSPSCIENEYNAREQVHRQRVGEVQGDTMVSGGWYQFQYSGDWMHEMKSRDDTKTSFRHRALGGTYVIDQEIVHNQIRRIPGITYDEPETYTITFLHDENFQLRTLTLPGGRVEEFRYVTQNREIIGLGDERDWVERDLTHLRDLSRGNLLRHRVTSPRAGEPEQITDWQYERLFNRWRRHADPRGVSTARYDNGWFCRSPERNANPLSIEHPPQKLPNGTSEPVVETFEYTRGGLLYEHRDPDGIVTRVVYDPAGNPSRKLVDPDGVALTWKYGDYDRGLARRIEDPNGVVLRHEYDDRDNLVETTHPYGDVLELEYDRNDQVVRSKRALSDHPAPFDYDRSTAPATQTIEYEYDILGNLRAEIVDPSGLALRSETDYDPEERTSVHRTPRATGDHPAEPAARTVFEYDSRGSVHSITRAPDHPTEAKTFFAYADDGNLRFDVSPLGGVTTYLYDGFGNLIQSRDPIGNVVVYQRDAARQIGRVLTFGPTGGPTPTDRGGASNVLLSLETFDFDARDRIVKHTQLRFDPLGTAPLIPQAATQTTRYSPGGRTAEEEDASARKTVYFYDSAGRRERIEYPAGRTAEFFFGSGTLVTRETHTDPVEGVPFLPAPGPLRALVTRGHDDMGRLQWEQVPGAGKTQFAYDSRSLLRAVKKPNGGIDEYRYDMADRLTDRIFEVEIGDFNTEGEIHLRQEHDENDNPTALFDGLDQKTEHGHDPHDRLTQVIDPDGQTTQVTYDGASNVLHVTDRANAKLEHEYDLASRLERREADTLVTDHLVQRFEYDGLGRLTRMTDSTLDGSEVAFHYDSVGNLLDETQDGLRVGLDYDPSGRLRRLEYPSGTALDIELSSSGRPQTFARAGRRFCDYSYQGPLVEQRTLPAVLVDPQTGDETSLPIITQQTINPHGQVTGHAHFLYDDVTNPADPLLIYLQRYRDMRYDAAGRLTHKEQDLAGRDHHVTFEYDKVNRLVHIEEDPSDRLGVATQSTRITLDAANNVRQRLSHVDPSPGSDFFRQQDDTPNALNAVAHRTTEVGSQSPVQETFAYDAAARLFSSRHVVFFDNPALLPRPGERRLYYDHAGRLTRCMVLTDGDEHSDYWIDYKYDAWGRRVERIEQRRHSSSWAVQSELHTRYVFWGERCIEEYERDAASEPWQPARRYYHGVRRGELIAVDVREDYVNEDIDNSGEIRGGATLGLLQDMEMTPVGLARSRILGTRFPVFYERYFTDSSGRVDRVSVSSTGSERYVNSSAIGLPVAQHGRWLHAREGLYYNGRRFYDPVTGQFVSPDPNGAWFDPAGLGNAYSYAGQNPAMNADYDGEIVVPVLLVAAYAIGTYLIAEHTESELAATFSPFHQGYSAWSGYTYFGNEQLTAAERGLRAVDAALSLVPGGGFFSGAWKLSSAAKGASKLSRTIRLAATLKTVNRIDDTILATRMGVAVSSAAYGSYLGWQNGSYSQVALLGASIGLSLLFRGTRGVPNEWARFFRKNPTGLGRRLLRSFWEDRGTFKASHDFFERWRSIFGAKHRWSMEHMILKQRYYRGSEANLLFDKGTLGNRITQSLGDAGWNSLLLPMGFNNRLDKSLSWLAPIINYGAYPVAAGVVYGAYRGGLFIGERIRDAAFERDY